jgi:hypothetical protein
MKRGALEVVFIDVDVIDWSRVQLNQLGVRRKNSHISSRCRVGRASELGDSEQYCDFFFGPNSVACHVKYVVHIS